MAAAVAIAASILVLSILTSAVPSDDVDLLLVDVKHTKPMRQKISHFRMYWHDILSGRENATSIPIVKSPTNTGFGQVNMIDNPLTLGPELGSKLVGRAQGFYALASQEELGFLMTMNFVFQQGKYNGSTLTILGWNSVLNAMREMPVVGGSGLFRFAWGYAQAHTHWYDPETGDATVSYDLHVMHY